MTATGHSLFPVLELAVGLPELKGQENHGSKPVAELTWSSIINRSSESFGPKSSKAITPTIKRIDTRPFFFRFLGSEFFLNFLSNHNKFSTSLFSCTFSTEENLSPSRNRNLHHRRRNNPRLFLRFLHLHPRGFHQLLQQNLVRGRNQFHLYLVRSIHYLKFHL